MRVDPVEELSLVGPDICAACERETSVCEKVQGHGGEQNKGDIGQEHRLSVGGDEVFLLVLEAREINRVVQEPFFWCSEIAQCENCLTINLMKLVLCNLDEGFIGSEDSFFKVRHDFVVSSFLI